LAALFALLLAGSLSGFEDTADRVYDAGSRLGESPQSVVLAGGTVLSLLARFTEPNGGCTGFMGEGLAGDLAGAAGPAFGIGVIAACPAVWALGGITGEEGVEDTGRDLTEGLILTYGIVGALKLGIERERPDGSDAMSFPSAHSAAAACVAAIIWERHGAAAGAPAAALAAFVALSRIHTGRHYPSDVVAGLAIGAACGMAMVEDHDEAGNGLGIRLGIGFDGNGAGVILR